MFVFIPFCTLSPIFVTRQAVEQTKGDIRFRVPALEEAEGTLEGLRSLRAEIVDSFVSKVRASAHNY